MKKDRPPPVVDQGGGSSAVVTPEIVAEAAVWVARLHGPDRSTRMERECLDWQQRSVAHRLAFERCTDNWEATALLSVVDAFQSAGRPRTESGVAASLSRVVRSRRGALGIAAAACLTAAVLIPLWRDPDVYATGVGEERKVLLEDGSRMSLNTRSRVRVDFDSVRRVVQVEEGEAIFEVAKEPLHPFIVRAAGSEIVAVGTVFCVRLGSAGAADALAVTLIEGLATVRASPGSASGSLAPASPLSLRTGDRVRLTRPEEAPGDLTSVRVDRPRIDDVTAWKRSEAIFDDVSLAEAVAELNRYSRTPIVLLGGAALATLRISGQYRTGDTAGAARAIAKLHGLTMTERPGRLELSKAQ